LLVASIKLIFTTGSAKSTDKKVEAPAAVNHS